jgi:hypothetical protein
VRADIDCHHEIAFNVKDNSQIRLDLSCVNRASVTGRKPVDFMGAQPAVKRVVFENEKRFSRLLLLLNRQLSETAPERTRRPEAILHHSPE